MYHCIPWQRALTVALVGFPDATPWTKVGEFTLQQPAFLPTFRAITLAWAGPGLGVNVGLRFGFQDSDTQYPVNPLGAPEQLSVIPPYGGDLLGGTLAGPNAKTQVATWTWSPAWAISGGAGASAPSVYLDGTVPAIFPPRVFVYVDSTLAGGDVTITFDLHVSQLAIPH